MATKLTIVSFYEKVSEILDDYKESILTEANAKIKLERLIAQAKRDELNVDMSTEVLAAINQNSKSEDGSSSEYEDTDSSMIC